MKSFEGAGGFSHFMVTEAPGLVRRLSATHSKLSAVFSTYRRVDGYETGLVEFDHPQLSVNVINGGGGIAEMQVITDAFRAAPLVAAIAGDQESKRVVGRLIRGPELAAVTRAAKELVLEGQLLLCLYLGVSAAGEVEAQAKDFRRQHPTATIIGMACTCGERPGEENNPFDYFLQSGACGMKEEMRDLLEYLLQNWPRIDA